MDWLIRLLQIAGAVQLLIAVANLALPRTLGWGLAALTAAKLRAIGGIGFSLCGLAGWAISTRRSNAAAAARSASP